MRGFESASAELYDCSINASSRLFVFFLANFTNSSNMPLFMNTLAAASFKFNFPNVCLNLCLDS